MIGACRSKHILQRLNHVVCPVILRSDAVLLLVCAQAAMKRLEQQGLLAMPASTSSNSSIKQVILHGESVPL